MALETGLRKAELLGLTWDRIDMTRGVLQLEITKSGRRREVPMRQAVYDTLATLPGAHEGRLWPAGSIRTAFEKAVAEAKLNAPFHFHDTGTTSRAGTSCAGVRFRRCSRSSVMRLSR